MNYYIYQNNEQKGPFSVSEIEKMNLKSETLVWFDGLENWQKISDVESLKHLLKKTPPPVPPLNPDKNQSIPPPISTVNSSKEKSNSKIDKDNTNKYFILGFVVIIFISIVYFSVFKNDMSREENNREEYNTEENTDNNIEETNQELIENTDENSNQTTRPRQKTDGEIQDELWKREIKNPTNYLSTSYDLNYKLLSGKDEITGTIFNSASFAGFKDIQLRVGYYTQTDAFLDEEYYTVYDYIYAGDEISYNLKVTSPKGTKRISVKVYNAEPIK